MTDLLSEVDEMMRRERMEKLWRDHGPKFIALLAAIILGTAIYSAWGAWDAHTKTRDTDALLTLMDAGTFPENVDLVSLDMRSDTKGVIALIAARAFLLQNEKDRALAAYEAISNDGSIDPELRQLGTLMKVRLQAQEENPDRNALQEDLKKIYKDNASPWRHNARLDAAALAAGAKDFKGAREILEPLLKEENLPATFIAKARALDHVYSLRVQNNGKDS